MMRSKRVVAITVCILFITACFGLALLSPQGNAQAGSAGGTSGGGDSGASTGRGTSVSSGRSAGMSTDAPGGGVAGQSIGGTPPGPAPGYYGGMAGRGVPYSPGTGESFQGYRYGAADTTETAFNAYQQYRHESDIAGLYRQVPVARTGRGKESSVQATGIVPDTCMWDCTASYTPVECRQLCNR